MPPFATASRGTHPRARLMAALAGLMARLRKRRRIRITETELRHLSPHVRRDMGLDL